VPMKGLTKLGWTVDGASASKDVPRLWYQFAEPRSTPGPDPLPDDGVARADVHGCRCDWFRPIGSGT